MLLKGGRVTGATPAVDPLRGAWTLFVLVAGGALVVGQQWFDRGHWIFSWATELAVAVAVLLTAWALGRRILRFLWPAGLSRALANYTATALGAGAIAATVFTLGSLGLLGRWPLALLPVAGTLLALVDAAPAFRGWIRSRPRPPTAPRVLEAMLLLLPPAGGLLYATLPPLFYDAIVYHLGLPNLYLA